MALALKKPINILYPIIFFVYADFICENVLVIVNGLQGRVIAHLFLFVFLVLQIFFAPLQAGFSDFYGRRKSLMISLSVSLLSIMSIYLYMQNILPIILLLVVATVIKGLWGNTVPISFAAIADTQNKNYRASYALASSMYSVGYITLIVIGYFSFSNTTLIYLIGIILIIGLIICIFQFKDEEDKTAHCPYESEIHKASKVVSALWKIAKKEIFLIKKELKRPLTRNALLAYVLWEISMYSILVYQVDLNPSDTKHFALIMMFGYLAGVAILRLKPCLSVKDSTMITWGYYVSFFSLIPYFILFSFIEDIVLLLGICYFLHALGNAFLSPTIFTIMVKERSSHDQGKVLGLVESADSIAFLLATILVLGYLHFRFPLFVLIAFSFFSFAISWIFYGPVLKKYGSGTKT